MFSGILLLQKVGRGKQLLCEKTILNILETTNVLLNLDEYNNKIAYIRNRNIVKGGQVKLKFLDWHIFTKCNKLLQKY